jgi:hypothetical protein
MARLIERPLPLIWLSNRLQGNGVRYALLVARQKRSPRRARQRGLKVRGESCLEKQRNAVSRHHFDFSLSTAGAQS